MPDAIRLVDYFYVMTADKPGEGARVLGQLKAAGVNLLAFHAFPSGRRAQLNLIPSDASALRAAARQANWKLVGPKKAFFLTGDDRPGALVEHYAKLAAAKINVVATDAIAVRGAYGAIVWVGARDVNKAAQVLGAV
ncbi:MAG TPA: hypothetical protein VNN19_07075 [bacterium]|nr:hypothetical protein [bacterium]